MSGRIGFRLRVAVLAAYLGDHPISERRARKAAEAGSREGMTVYGLGLACLGRPEEAERWLRKAMAAGDPLAPAALGTLCMESGESARGMAYLRGAEATHGALSARLALIQVWARRTVPFDAKVRPAGVPDPALPPSPSAEGRAAVRAGRSAADWAELRRSLKPNAATDSPDIIPAMLITRAPEGDMAEAHSWFIAAAEAEAEAGPRRRPGAGSGAERPPGNESGNHAPDPNPKRRAAPEPDPGFGSGTGTGTESGRERRPLSGPESESASGPDDPHPDPDPESGLWATLQRLFSPGEDVPPEVGKALGAIAARAGDLAAAEAWFADAARSGDPEALLFHAEVHADRHGMDRAEGLFRKAAEAGNPAAQHTLGVRLMKRGQNEEAERYFRTAAAAGYIDSVVNLGVLLRGRGDLDGAEACYRRAIEAGDIADSNNNLGNLLRQRGDMAGAARSWRIAAAHGNGAAMASCGALHAEREEWAEAEALFRRSAAAGDTTGMLNLATILRRDGRIREAAQWLQSASGATPTQPQPDSAPGPGSDSAPDLGAVADWLRGPAERGDATAREALNMIEEAEEAEEADDENQRGEDPSP
ncbi:tetratricopeptide repeat protein [Streptomyces sp. NPDC052236]|uniref:tetratricopeptide repeat protein n=1 Tax=Streptomyces sp. NPDC052236 TaxID=3365686 RepID=UPI0037D47F37